MCDALRKQLSRINMTNAGAALVVGTLLCFAPLRLVSAQEPANNSPPAAAAQPAEKPAAVPQEAAVEATKKVAIPTDPQSVVELMGVWMIPFIVASVILVWYSLERLVVLRRGRVIPKAFVKSFLDDLKNSALDQPTAMTRCEQHSSPVAKLFIYAIEKWGRPSIEVEQGVLDGGERIVSRLRTHVRALNTISVIMPMVGLLGTVVGLIQAFNDIAEASAMGNIDALAASIAIALLTTAFGLGVAIPALVMYIYLCGRVESLVMELDELGHQVAFLVSLEHQQMRAPTQSASTKPRTKSFLPENVNS